MSETWVYFDGPVGDLFEFVIDYLKEPSLEWPEEVMIGPGDKTERGWRLSFVEPHLLADEEKRELGIPDHATEPSRMVDKSATSTFGVSLIVKLYSSASR